MKDVSRLSALQTQMIFKKCGSGENDKENKKRGDEGKRNEYTEENTAQFYWWTMMSMCVYKEEKEAGDGHVYG